MTDAIPEQDIPQEDLSLIMEEEPETVTRRIRIRPEVVMGVIALLSALVLVLAIAVSLPYIRAEREEAAAQSSQLWGSPGAVVSSLEHSSSAWSLLPRSHRSAVLCWAAL